MKWEPIETAPKDGTSVLVAGGTMTYSGWFGGEPVECTETCIARWIGDSWMGAYGEEYGESWYHTPTHWMPIPQMNKRSDD